MQRQTIYILAYIQQHRFRQKVLLIPHDRPHICIGYSETPAFQRILHFHSGQLPTGGQKNHSVFSVHLRCHSYCPEGKSALCVLIPKPPLGLILFHFTKTPMYNHLIHRSCKIILMSHFNVMTHPWMTQVYILLSLFLLATPQITNSF